MSSSQELLEQYRGSIVPRSFDSGFVTLSYVVSLLGAAATLELLNRRTSRNGLPNHILLVSAAVSMGGIAIWCMHFVGNRAVVLGNGQMELQIAYSNGFTALSFFIPIVVLIAAFIAVGTNSKVSWPRIVAGGTIAGSAICGMHYLGNASISNYRCIYSPANVVGAALIAVAASIVALSFFFGFRAAWTNSWWKRGLSAIVLAGAVSGMHWCASTGTQYRLIRLNTTGIQLARGAFLSILVCFSVAAALILVGSAIYTTYVMRRYAHKAQQVVLAAAVFDRDGRILVTPDGLLPSEKITDTYIERTPSDTFSVAHPLFHWMFQASRNWHGLRSIIGRMGNHVAHLPRISHNAEVQLIDDNGQTVENYDIVIRELFCLAAANLAERMKDHLINIGILWDEILATGVDRPFRHSVHSGTSDSTRGSGPATPVSSEDGIDLAEKAVARKTEQHEYGRGSLMFLVRRLKTAREVERLEAAGFRFADVNQVHSIIWAGMQIKTRDLRAKLADMASYAENDNMMKPGVYVGLFGVKARVGSFGFDVLVLRSARNCLPSMRMPLDRLEPWQIEFIRQLDQLTVPAVHVRIREMTGLSPREMLFVSQLDDTIEALRTLVNAKLFNEAVLSAKTVQIPCLSDPGSTPSSTCTMIALQVVIPIHANIQSSTCEFIPLSFFKVQQLVYRDSPQQAAFARHVHRELAPVVNAVPPKKSEAPRDRGRMSFRSPSIDSFANPFRRSTPPRPSTHRINEETEAGNTSSMYSDNSESLWKFWRRSSREGEYSHDDQTSAFDAARYMETPRTSVLGGILVSQEVKVDVSEARGNAGAEDSVQTSVDAFKTTHHQPDGVSRRLSTDRSTIVTEDSKTASDLTVEIHPPPQIPRDVVYSGSPWRSAMAGTEDLIEGPTFVDELFSTCMDGR